MSDEDEKKKEDKKKEDKKKKSSKKIEVNLEPELDNSQIHVFEAPLTVAQRRKKALVFKRSKNKIKRGREKAAKKLAGKDKLEGRARKKAIQALRSKFAGKKGENYDSLSYAQKTSVDKIVAKKKNLVGKISKKLLPNVRKAERERFANRNKKSVSEAWNDLHHRGFYGYLGSEGVKTKTIDKWEKEVADQLSLRQDSVMLKGFLQTKHGTYVAIDFLEHPSSIKQTVKAEFNKFMKTQYSPDKKLKDYYDEEVHYDINKSFELFLETQEPKKRYHKLLDKDGKTFIDNRFKIYKNKKIDEDLSVLEKALNICK